MDATELSAPRPADQTESWWSRTAGGREVLFVALPLVVSSLSWTVMTFVDRIFLKWESGDAMAAAFSASTLWFSLLCLPLGICMYCATFVSQYFGNRQHTRIGPAVWQGVWVAGAISPVLLLAIPAAPQIFAVVNHETPIMLLEIRYFRILCWGIPAMLTAQALSTFFAGRGKTGVVMTVDASVAVLNLVLDYFWIFGKAGFPEMGIDGAGWATVASLCVKALIYFALLFPAEFRQKYCSLHWRFDPELFRRLMYYGAPSGFQLMIDVVGFTVLIILVGRLGPVQAEATTMAFSISTLAFMPIWGFAQATSILVGQHLGENRDDFSARATWTTLQISLFYMAVVSLLYLVTPGLFLAPFFAAADRSVGDNAVWLLSVNLLRFVAAYNLLDATMMIFVHAVKGAGDTRFVLNVSGVMASIMILGSWLTVEVYDLGIYACWGLITCVVWVMGVVYLLRFMQGKWRSMRVIEQTVPLDVAVSN